MELEFVLKSNANKINKICLNARYTSNYVFRQNI